MQNDLAALKKGQTPSGISLEKTATPQKLAVPPITKPVVPLPPPPSPISVQLGKTQIAKPLNQPTPLTPLVKKLPLTPMTTNGIAVPKTSSLVNRKNLGLLVVSLVIVGGGIASYFIYSKYSREGSTPTPTVSISETPIPTPAPINDLLQIFGTGVSSIDLSSGTDPYLEITSKKQNVGAGELTFHRVNSGSETLSFFGFLSKLLVNHPTELDSLNDTNGLLLSMAGPMPGISTKPSLGVIVAIKNIEEVKSTMFAWEATAPQDLKGLLGITPDLKASPTFLDNIYQNIPIRYINFPANDSTLDYAVIGVSPDLNLLVITSSKNLIYSLIDLVNNVRR